MSEAISPARTAAAPARTAPVVHRGRRGQALKFLGSLRGEGALISELGETPVAYQVDVFESAAGRTGSGTVDGAMLDTSEDAGGEARLRLANGRELAVVLQGMNERGAMFETRGEPPKPG